MDTSQELDVDDDLARAAADLEALTAKFDARTRQVEHLEALLEAILDEPDLEICLVGGDLHIRAMSRGMAARWSNADRAVGRRLDQVAGESWGDVDALLRSASDDRSEERAVEGGTLQVRRASRRGDPATDAVFVLRFVGR